MGYKRTNIQTAGIKPRHSNRKAGEPVRQSMSESSMVGRAGAWGKWDLGVQVVGGEGTAND